MMPITIIAKLEMDKDGTWWFIHVPKETRDNLKHLEHRGSIKVTATVGNSTWACSLLPWADGSAQMNIPKKIRSKENLKLGDGLTASIIPERWLSVKQSFSK